MNKHFKATSLVVVCGPTASGKTKLAVDLAKQFDGEVISSDSMQIYRQMDIVTAKPSLQEQEGVPHHLLSIKDPQENFSLAEYLSLAKAAIDDIQSRGKLPILAGGTGLYINSLIDNVKLANIPCDIGVRERIEAEYDYFGGERMLKVLAKFDPTTAHKLHPNDKTRIIRAIEVFTLTNIPISRHRELSIATPSRYNLSMIGLCFNDRQLLYQRINNRVDQMLCAGLLAEMENLSRQKLSDTASQAIGYKELLDYFKGRETLSHAVENIKTQSRRYAKRQLTWFRRDSRINWLAYEDFASYDMFFEKAAEIVLRDLLQ